MKEILILGGTGFIGFNIARSLSKDINNRITLADNLSRGKVDNEVLALLEQNNVDIIRDDFTDFTAFNKLKNSYDQVYMLASVVGVNSTLQVPHEVIRINTMLIINTLEWIRRSKIGKMLFTSTSENYAGTIDSFGYTIPTPEDIPLSISDIGHPRFTYAVTKILGESAFLNYSKALDINCTIVRYHNVYGPRMGFKHLIPHLIERFRSNESPFQVYGAKQTRAFCFIDDAVEGTIRAMNSSKANGEIYHLGTETEITIMEIVKMVGRQFDFKGVFEAAPTFPGSTDRRCPAIQKAQKDFDFRPNVELSEGLKITIDWYNNFMDNNEIYEGSFEKPQNL
jgi:UDP-glucose 4-epimerase